MHDLPDTAKPFAAADVTKTVSATGAVNTTATLNTMHTGGITNARNSPNAINTVNAIGTINTAHLADALNAVTAADAVTTVTATRTAGVRQGTSPVPAARRLNADPETVERDLIRLVLTIVELLRQLMERTAIHRVDQGDLDEEQEERVGCTLLALEDRMAELCDRYGLTMDDLNLDLGPLGSLLPRD
ncbi:hypothetical protein FHS42_004150 [Streptomyces zagrosensis]|uniref:Gas vesicle protein K n=1 Tax=Streptomyces zagrosensis TaxID=1042984 RepID=A0A7W9QBI2_9ACTN|nr:hypothetical protein [Streptomyces zagrosensis]